MGLHRPESLLVVPIRQHQNEGSYTGRIGRHTDGVGGRQINREFLFLDSHIARIGIEIRIRSVVWRLLVCHLSSALYVRVPAASLRPEEQGGRAVVNPFAFVCPHHCVNYNISA